MLDTDKGVMEILNSIESQLRHTWEKLRHSSLLQRFESERSRLQEIRAFLLDSSEAFPGEPETQDLAKSVSSLLLAPFVDVLVDEEGRSPVPVILSMVDVEISSSDNDSGSKNNPNPCFKIVLALRNSKTGSTLTWSVVRSLLEVVKLHYILVCKHLVGDAPTIPDFPNQTAYYWNSSVLGLHGRIEERRSRVLLARQRNESLQRYIYELFQSFGCVFVRDVCEFFEISTSSATLAPFLREKGIEGFVMRKTDQNQAPLYKRLFWLLFYFTKSSYAKEWLVIRDGCLLLFEDFTSTVPNEVIVCSQNCSISFVNRDTKNPLKPLKVTLSSGFRSVEFIIAEIHRKQQWAELFASLLKNPWSVKNRNGSFAPVRHGCDLKFLIDAHSYYEELGEQLLAAKKEIFILGLLLTPELALRRPASEFPEFRLDQLLKRKAEEGVRVYIAIYREFPFGKFQHVSWRTKTFLERLHPNIQVMRSPVSFFGDSLFWTHHEKLVIIDQSVAFVGGIDLAFGRYDTAEHKIFDIHSSSNNPNESAKIPLDILRSSSEIWTGIDYYNPIVKDVYSYHAAGYVLSPVDRNYVPRLPWHDIQCSVTGPVVVDLHRHFMQRWNHVRFCEGSQSVLTPIVPLVAPSDRPYKTSKESRLSAQVVRSVGPWSMGIPIECSYYNACLNIIQKAERFIYLENQFLISRGSPQDVDLLKNSLIPLIVERILKASAVGAPLKVIIIVPLLPAFEGSGFTSSAISELMIRALYYGLLQSLQERGIDPLKYVGIFSLRTWLSVDNRVVTEQIYVHSKLLIVDDRWAIIGSANSNDRSLCGDRDSEIGIVVNEHRLHHHKDNDGKKFRYGRDLYRLRRRLLQEHLGKEDDDDFNCIDPASPHFWDQTLYETANRNSDTYAEIFRCYPEVLSLKDACNFQVQRLTNASVIDPTEDQLRLLRESIRGHLVRLPLEALALNDLRYPYSYRDPESYLHANIFS